MTLLTFASVKDFKPSIVRTVSRVSNASFSLRKTFAPLGWAPFNFQCFLSSPLHPITESSLQWLGCTESSSHWLSCPCSSTSVVPVSSWACSSSKDSFLFLLRTLEGVMMPALIVEIQSSSESMPEVTGRSLRLLQAR